ncbi:MAG: HAMP domain-containing protein [Chloroflexi bacterium]|nr:HAMP domain-containing protein [Chloroflexota bacterium]
MKLLDKLLRSKLFKTSLRFKVVVAFVLPMILVLSVLSYMNNARVQKELEEQIQMTTIQLGDMALSGMKLAMLRNDQEVVTRIVQNYGTNPSINEIRIVDLEYQVVVSANTEEVGKIFSTDRAGCMECHRYSPSKRPRVTPLKLNEEVLRVVTPVSNEPQCQTCHSADKNHLGVLIIDAPLSVIAEHRQEDQAYNVAISLLSILLVIVLAYMMIQWLVVKRVGILYEYLNAFATGDFSVRIPKVWRTEDEITRLAEHFNAIANALERHQKEQREIAIVRQEAIAEERERIAHELHDGVAQLLAYLTTKISAARLLLRQQRSKVADNQLSEMEDVVQKQALDVRAIIVGLRLLGQAGTGLVKSLKDYVAMCNRLGELNVLLEIGPGVDSLHIDPETELHLLRIVQESVSNARKHSSATEIRIKISVEDGELFLGIEDNGIGFDPWQIKLWRSPHFGLHTMGERAEKIGASFKVESAHGKGVQVSVRLKLKEN